jgi:hypothetical protein
MITTTTMISTKVKPRDEIRPSGEGALRMAGGVVGRIGLCPIKGNPAERP